jgi:hypothetical protein
LRYHIRERQYLGAKAAGLRLGLFYEFYHFISFLFAGVVQVISARDYGKTQDGIAM